MVHRHTLSLRKIFFVVLLHEKSNCVLQLLFSVIFALRRVVLLCSDIRFASVRANIISLLRQAKMSRRARLSISLSNNCAIPPHTHKNPVHFVSGIFTFYFLPLHFGGEYYNDNGHLPSKEGRIWYEADINYRFGQTIQ